MVVVYRLSLPRLKMEKLEEGRSLKDNRDIEINECGGEPEPHCLSSMSQFRYRVWEFIARWKYILLCW